MDFMTAVRTCLTEKYVGFSGRASRPEYWWFILAYVIGAVIIGLIGVWFLQLLYSIALFLPAAAVGYRRLQDTGRPGWYYFIPMGLSFLGNFVIGRSIEVDPATGMPLEMPSAGVIGFSMIYGLIMLVVAVVFIYWLIRPSQDGENEYGPQPAA